MLETAQLEHFRQNVSVWSVEWEIASGIIYKQIEMPRGYIVAYKIISV